MSNGTVDSVDTGSSGVSCEIRTATVLVCSGLELSPDGNYVVEVSAVAGTEGELAAQAYAAAHDVDTDRMDNADRAQVGVSKPDTGNDGGDSGGGGIGFLLFAGLLALAVGVRRSRCT